MTMQLYSIYDKRADEFSPVETCKTDAVFSRLYLSRVKGQYATDFIPYCVGTLDIETGKVTGLPPRVVSIDEIEELHKVVKDAKEV